MVLHFLELLCYKSIYCSFRWPDRGIPSHENAMIPLKLLSLVRDTRAPCVVHCSAGIGRTGTVVAIELGIRRFHDGRKVDLAMVSFFGFASIM